MSNFFERIFKRQDTKKQTNVEVIHGEGHTFSIWHGNYYDNPVYRSALDVIAKNTAKLKPIHFAGNNQGSKELNHLLQVKANEYYSSYDLIYKFITHLYLKNNAYIFIRRDKEGKVIGLYNVDYTNTEYGDNRNGDILVKFYMTNGDSYLLPYADLIHLKRNFNSHKLTGDSNNSLDNTLETSELQTHGIAQGIKMGANIRGVISFTEVLNDEDLKIRSEKFVNEYLSISNNGGVVASDHSMTYTPIDTKPYQIDKDQIEVIENRIFQSLGINKNIVSGQYNEQEFQAFYENVIENIAIQMGLEFTIKLFNDKEQEFGNRIIFDAHRLNYASLQTKVNLIQQAYPYGLLTVNEARELLNLPKLDDPEEGKQRYQTLNIVPTDISKEYQSKGIDNKLTQLLEQNDEKESENERN